MQRNVSRPPDFRTFFCGQGSYSECIRCVRLCTHWEQFARHTSLWSCQLVTGVLPLPVTYLLQPSNGFTSRIYANQWYSSLSLVAFSIACLNVYVAANHFQCLCGLSVKYCVAWIFNLLLLECLNPVQMDDLGWHCSFTEMLLGPRLVLP